MTRKRAAFCATTTLLSLVSLLPAVFAAPPTTDGGATASATKPKSDLPTQSSLASKTVTFGTTVATASDVKAAIDAHDLAKAKTMDGKPLSFVGTVAKIYAPKSNKIVILNFDKDFKTALTAVVFSDAFAKFPDLKTLEGKKLLVSGKAKEYHGSEEIEVAKPDQIKIVK